MHGAPDRWPAVAARARTPRQHHDPPRSPTTLRQEITEGLVLVFRDPYLRPLSLFGGVANFALDGYGAIIVVFLVRVVGLNAATVGLLLAVPGIAGMAGALIARRFAAKVGSARALLLSALTGLPFALLVPLTGPGFRLVFYLAGVLVAVIGVAVTNIIMASFRQTYCAQGTLGRVTATMRFLILGTSPLGALAGGALGSWLGLRTAMWITIAVLTGSGPLLLTRSFVTSTELPATPPATLAAASKGRSGPAISESR
jgi:predicted MFS family arabinose efflux permease